MGSPQLSNKPLKTQSVGSAWREFASPTSLFRHRDRRLPSPTEAHGDAWSSQPRPRAPPQLSRLSRLMGFSSHPAFCNPATSLIPSPGISCTGRWCPRTGARSPAPGLGTSPRDNAALRSGFPCFGFFTSRFDRFVLWTSASLLPFSSYRESRIMAFGGQRYQIIDVSVAEQLEKTIL